MVGEHIPGTLNGLADVLSRNNVSQVPCVCRQPTEIPHGLVELLLTHQPDWTSQSRMVLWERIFMKGLAESTHT